MIHPLQVTLQRREVHRTLGYRRGARPRARVAARLDALWLPAADLLAPLGAFRWVDGETAAGLGMPDPGAEVGVGACTIGGALEAAVERRSGRGEVLDALLLDAIGSAVAVAAADALDRILCAELSARGRHRAPRVSPGYGRWDVARQPDLLALLPTRELGIGLTAGSMMVPRKSVSFAVRVLEGRPAAAGGRRAAERCAGCELRDCAFRREAPAAPAG